MIKMLTPENLITLNDHLTAYFLSNWLKPASDKAFRAIKNKHVISCGFALLIISSFFKSAKFYVFVNPHKITCSNPHRITCSLKLLLDLITLLRYN